MRAADNVRVRGRAVLAALAGFFRGAMCLHAPGPTGEERPERGPSGEAHPLRGGVASGRRFEERWREGGPNRCC
jgi:hypothetical protein